MRLVASAQIETRRASVGAWMGRRGELDPTMLVCKRGEFKSARYSFDFEMDDAAVISEGAVG